MNQKGHDVCGNMSPLVSPMFTYPLSHDMTVLGVQPHKGPKNPNFNSIDCRIRSYQQWDHSVPVGADQLSSAGFFSIGMSDYVKCFYCDGGLCNWERGDDPWVEHAKWFPDCHFVRLNKSEAFVDECRRLADSESDPEVNHSSGYDSDDDSADTLAIHAVNEWLNTDIVLQLMDLNAFPIDVIKAVLNKRWHRERQPFHSFAQLYDAVSQWSSRSNTQNSQPIPTIPTERTAPEEHLQSSDEELPSSQSSLCSTSSSVSTCSSCPAEVPEVLCCEPIAKCDDNRLLCKICLDREIGVVFLPCGHQLACTQCAPCITDCPICRKVIRGTVRTFFS